MNKIMSITLNGEAHQVTAGMNMEAFLTSLGLAPQSVATAVNQVFVPRDQRASRPLMAGDAVFTFQPITGG
jgi:sulfur carrier protein